MEEENKTGYYLMQTLKDEKISRADIQSLISFVLSVKMQDYDDDFSMSSDLRFALNGIREGYTALSREYEPSVEYVLYNSLMQDEIISSLKKLAGKRNNKQDMKAIEAIKKNLIIERFRAKMDTQTKLDEGSFIGQLKLILVKRQII